MKLATLRHAATVLPLLTLLSFAASAATVTVAGNADLYNADGLVYDGIAPVAINVTGLSQITFAVSAGATVSVNGGGNFNDADGIGSANGESDSGTATISGITTPTAGFVAGVFFGSAAATSAPTALDFRSTGLGTSFASLAPQLQQAFFIGDGRTGDATGAIQVFYVPTGATTLYLGLTDACGYSGSPGCFYDNSGSFSVTTNGTTLPVVGAVPEPGTWALLAAGLGAVGFGVRRRPNA